MRNLSEAFGYNSQNRLIDVWLDAPQTVTYTGFDKVLKVKQGGDSLCYSYGHDRQRIAMEEHVGNTLRTKRYVGSCEFVTLTGPSGTQAKSLTFLTGPTGVCAVVVTEDNVNTVHYVLKDNLGSWTAITDSEGNLEQRLSYDAWGNLRYPRTWENYPIGDPFAQPLFDRGFTGHEHLWNFGLINMNGRMYDPLVSSFLSADRFVQNPETAQGFNRYAYCMHNPLRYVDPSGWEMRKPVPGRTPNTSDFYMDPYAYAERALEPRDLGILQLPTSDPSVVWMEENELHGGSGVVVSNGGWYQSGNEIYWSPTISSQGDLDQLGIIGTFLGQRFVDEKSRMYYGILGKKYDLKSFDGKMAQKIEECIINHIEFLNAMINYNTTAFDTSEPIEKSTDFTDVTTYSIDCFGWGINNRVEFYYEGAKGYFYQYNPKDPKNKNGILAKFGSWPTSVSGLNTYGFPGKIMEGYQIFFPKTNAESNKIPVIILVFPNTNTGYYNYLQYYNNIKTIYNP